MVSLPVLNTNLEKYQRWCIESNGCQLVDSNEGTEIEEEVYFKFDEDLLFSPNFVREILGLSQGQQSSLQFSLAANLFNERFVLPHSNSEIHNLIFNFFFNFN